MWRSFVSEKQRPMTAGELSDALLSVLHQVPGARRWEVVWLGHGDNVVKVAGLDYDLWTEHPHFTLTRSS